MSPTPRSKRHRNALPNRDLERMFLNSGNLPMTLQEAAEKTAGCDVDDTGWFGVRETFRGKVVWDGPVTLFETDIEPRRIIFGWTVKGRNGDRPEHVTVEKEGQIDSAMAAVHAWIIAQA